MLFLNVFGNQLKNLKFLNGVAVSLLHIEPTKVSLNYSPEEELRILETINCSDVTKLSRFTNNKSRIKNLWAYKKKYGSFKNLNELLDVEGIGARVLKKLCENIIQDLTIDSNNEKSSKSHKMLSLATPELDQSQIENIHNVVGINLGPATISWTGFELPKNKMFAWGCKPLPFPNESKRVNEAQLIEMAYNLKKYIPEGCIYVLEGSTSTRSQQPLNVSVNLQKLQLTSMLHVLLTENKSDDSSFRHKVFYLKSAVWPKLFGTLVGTERISAQSVVEDVLLKGLESDQMSADETVKKLTENYLSAQLMNNKEVIKNDVKMVQYTPVNVSIDMVMMYRNRDAVVRECLGSCLLLTMAFLDLIIYRNSASLKLIRGFKKNKVPLI